MNHHNLTRREAVGNWTLVVCRSWTPELDVGIVCRSPVAESPTDRTKVQLWPRRAMVKLKDEKCGTWPWCDAVTESVPRRTDGGGQTMEDGRWKQFT